MKSALSRRGHLMPASPIRKLVPHSDAAKARGVHVYHLNIGQPDIETPPAALDAVRNTALKIVEYSHSAGIPSYRHALLSYYRRQGIELASEDILVTTGASEGILFALFSCLDPGDEIIIPEPFYTNYFSFCLTAGVNVVPVTSAIENDFALPPVRAFEKCITPRTRAILICNPNNPTGYLYTERELRELQDIAVKNDLYLIADEVYREFCYDGRAHFSAMNLRGMEEQVIMIDSVSKRYSLCGARVGALISRNRAVTAAALKFAQARLSPPAFGQVAAEAAIKTGEDYFLQLREEYLLRRNLAVSALNRMRGVKCPLPGGAFYAMAQLPVDDSDRFALWMLEEFEHEKQTVMLAPGKGFYATEGLGADQVRVAYVLNTEDLRRAMLCLEKGLECYPWRREKTKNVITINPLPPKGGILKSALGDLGVM